MTPLPIEITLGEEPGTRNLAPGHVHSILGDPAVAFRIEGVGSFRASGPTGSVDELRDKWEQATGAFQQLISGFGTDEIEELERLHQKAAELDTQIGQAEVRLTTLLSGRQFDALLADRAQADSGLQEMLAMHPDWEAASPDPEQLLREADELERQFTDAIDRAEADSDRAQDALNRALGKQGEHEGEIKNAQRRQTDLQTQLEALSGDGLTDQQRNSQLTELAMQRDAARGKLAAAEEKRAEFGDDPASSVTVLERQLTAVRQEKTAAEKELNTQSGRLEEITADAPYTALAVAEEELGRCREELAREQLHIDAVRLLHDTLQEQKRDVMHSVIGPVRLRANHLLQRIAGTRFQDIRFEESLLPSGVAPRSLGEPVSLDEISGGEREQLYFAVRLALASVAFGEERQLVVLDDVFTYTDTPRLARIAAILEETAERFQIIMLTCHPERYRGLPKATFFDMEKIAAG